jgi:hypothetical protein
VIRRRASVATLLVITGLTAACGGGGKGAAGSGAQLDIKYELAAPCVPAGGTQTVTARTSARANVAYAVIYSDGNFHGEAPKGDADGHGVFEGTWVVPADAPPGRVEVRLLAALSNKTGSASVPFIVSGKGTTCSDALAAAVTSSTTPRAVATTLSGAATTAPSPGATAAQPSTTTTSSTIPKGQFKSTITLGKSCANSGDVQTFVVKTAPNSPITVVTRYADNDSHGDNTGGISDSDGKFAGSFVVDPTAPKGEAMVLATTSSRTQGVSFAEDRFKVGC